MSRAYLVEEEEEEGEKGLSSVSALGPYLLGTPTQ